MIIAQKAGHQKLLPMVKADAYGHDAVWVSRVLWNDSRARSRLHAFGVATFEEALELRRELPAVSRKIAIMVFSDCAPFSKDWYSLCQKQNLEPVLSEIRTFLEFQKYHLGLPASKRIRFHVEVNTGMNRLGIPLDSLSLVHSEPASVFTHLAESESPKSPLSVKQLKAFQSVIDWKKRHHPKALIHFANSGAIWNASHFPFYDEMNLVRPGLSLYGVRPYAKAKNEGLKPVMTFEAPVIQKTFLEKGERVGYNGIYRSDKKSGEWVATLAAGYADGVFRSLANQDLILGKVSMDLITVKATARTRIGNWVALWGEGVDPYAIAERANTIPYEITTRLGGRVKRVYE